MVTGCAKTPGCVAYVGVSFLNQAEQSGLGEAKLANKSGKYMLLTAKSIKPGAADLAAQTPSNEAISLIDGPAADGYPIVNYEYAVVDSHQKDAVDRADSAGVSPLGDHRRWHAAVPGQGALPAAAGRSSEVVRRADLQDLGLVRAIDRALGRKPVDTTDGPALEHVCAVADAGAVSRYGGRHGHAVLFRPDQTANARFI